MITGVILAGGLGTRLHSVLPDRPKVLAEVNARPFITFLLEQMAEAGIQRFLLCIGHLGEEVRNTIGDSYRGLPVRYSQEPAPRGTAGALRLALDSDSALERDSGDVWLVLNGDSYVAADFRAFLAWHEAREGAASVLLTWVENSARFGTVDVCPDGRIHGFYEKRGRVEPGWINSGVYLFSRSRLESMPHDAPLSLERDVMPSWIDAGLWGYPVKAPFLDIGTPDSLKQADSFFASIANARKPRRFVIVDRDGTIIEEKNYLSSPDQVSLLPNAAAGLKRLRDYGLGVIMVTNQSGIGRGYFDRQTVDRIHDRIRELLQREGTGVDAIFICPHTPEEQCECRKPRTGLVDRAAREFGFNPSDAFYVGDKSCDIDLGLAFQGMTFLVRTGYGSEHLRSGQAKPRFVVNDLEEAAEMIGAILKERPMPSVESLVGDARTRLKSHLLASIAVKQRVLEECEGPILSAAALIVQSFRDGNKLLLCGNGGSAADCQHIAGELVSVLNQSFPRPGLAAIALTTDSSILTASANDFGYEGVFERQTQALGRPGDILLGISTSGNSENVVRALRYGAAHGMHTICLTGASGRMTELAEIAIRVPSPVVQHIQEAHITIGHIICDLVEQTLFGAQT
jgi:phosphoheptose isomerase